MEKEHQKILILGAGYAGLQVALELSRQGYQSILLDKSEFHELKPELPHLLNRKRLKTKIPLKSLTKDKKIKLIFGQADLINYQEKEVALVSGEKIKFDYLVLALGSEANYYNIPGLKENALILLETEQAEAYVKQIEINFAQAKNLAKNDPDRAKVLTFVIGGGGLTGVEVASEMGYLIPKLLKKYPEIDEQEVKVYLIEGMKSLLPGTEENLSKKIEDFFKKKQSNVSLILNTFIKEVKENEVILSNQQKIVTKSILWTGGIKGSSFLEKEFINLLGERENFILSRGSRLEVDQFFRVKDSEHTFAIGDIAVYKDPQTRQQIPPNGQIACKQGKLVAQNIIRLIKQEELVYKEIRMQGVLVSLGPNSGSGIIYDPVKLELPLGFVSRKIKALVEARYKYFDIA